MGDGEDFSKFEGLLSQFGDYGKAIGKALWTNFNYEDIGKQIELYEEKAINVVQSFGTGRDRIVELKASMADAVVSVTKLGGGLGDVESIAKSIAEGLNRNMILTSESYEKLYATTKVTGQSYEKLLPAFKDAGFSVYQISENMKKVVDIATASGVNAKAVAGDVLSKMSMMDKYNFAGGVEGLAKMVTQATNLRISANEIEKVMNKAFEPDQAIEMAAALQRLGVAQSDLLDPLRLMDLAQNDPAELQNQIVEMSKSFVEFDEKSKSFQIAPGAKRQLQEVASAMGMSASELAKMAKGAAELEDKMNKIHFPGDMFTEEQKTMIANMAEMGPGGEYMLRINGEDLKLDEAMIKMQSMDEESRNKFLADSKPKTMEEMAKEQLTVGKQQLAAIKSLANVRGAAYASTSTQEMAFGASMEVTNAITKLMGSDNLSVKGLRQSQEKMTTEMIGQIQSGDLTGAVDTFTKESKSYLDKSFDDFIKNGTEAMNDIKNSSNPLIGIFTSLATEVGKVVTNYEKLNTSAGTTKTTPEKSKVTVTATPTTTTPENKEVKTTSEEKTKTESTTTEFKFNPLEIKLTISGLLPGMSEEQIKQLIIDGKLNEALYDAVKNAEKTKVTK